YLIIGSHQQEVRSDIYGSSEWSEFDFAIAAVVYFFSIVLGIPFLNRAWQKDFQRFADYAVLVSGACLFLFFLSFLISRARRGELS
ncbi:MAG: hypothetical protein K2G19_08040, partial [Lachnospiraceae bacterium]|nr:hypothetical protein [Lachnospiraceae bacterium]